MTPITRTLCVLVLGTGLAAPALGQTASTVTGMRALQSLERSPLEHSVASCEARYRSNTARNRMAPSERRKALEDCKTGELLEDAVAQTPTPTPER